MVSFIDKHRVDYGVEPICKQLPIAPSTYHDHKARERDPDRESNRSMCDRHLEPEIERVHGEFRVCTTKPANFQIL